MELNGLCGVIEQGLRFASPPTYILVTPMALYYIIM